MPHKKQLSSSKPKEKTETQTTVAKTLISELQDADDCPTLVDIKKYIEENTNDTVPMRKAELKEKRNRDPKPTTNVKTREEIRNARKEPEVVLEERETERRVRKQSDEVNNFNTINTINTRMRRGIDDVTGDHRQKRRRTTPTVEALRT